MDQEEKDYLWSLMPGWVKEVPKGYSETFYGTLSYEKDLEVHEKVKKLLNQNRDE